VKLTIELGLVIKLQSGMLLLVEGGLDANGVIFTSYQGDAHSGDTTGDGPPSGQAGDWLGIL
jgi:hypothetical protein